MNLEQTLQNASKKIWKELSPVSNKGTHKVFEVREEALTTMALKKLIIANCPDIAHIEMIPGCEETLKGYDFELVIGSITKRKFVRLLVQAKKLNGKTTNSNYSAIDFDQTDTLINYSKSIDSLATYAFYNHLVDSDTDLIYRYNSETPFLRQHLGITICSAYSVKRLQSRKFDDYHFHRSSSRGTNLYALRRFPSLFYFHRESRSHLAIPFHEVAHFSIDIAERINRIYKRIRARGRSYFFFFFVPGLEDFFSNENDLIPILNTDLESIIKDFKNRTLEQSSFSTYKPQALIVINTDVREPE
jgi:hypothetical protein